MRFLDLPDPNAPELSGMRNLMLADLWLGKAVIRQDMAGIRRQGIPTYMCLYGQEMLKRPHEAGGFTPDGILATHLRDFVLHELCVLNIYVLSGLVSPKLSEV